MDFDILICFPLFSPRAVAKSFLRLTSLSLYGTNISKDITGELFTRMANQKDFKLRKINLGRGQKHISTIEPVVFARAVLKLEEVCLQDSNLTYKQLKQLFQDLISKASRIEFLSLTFGKVEASMNMEFMAKALKNIRDVEYEGMDSAYFDTFIALVKKDPKVKTRYISTK